MRMRSIKENLTRHKNEKPGEGEKKGVCAEGCMQASPPPGKSGRDLTLFGTVWFGVVTILIN